MPLQLFTIGHSTHPIERFIALLNQHGIEALADIRRFPGSKRLPHFSRESLAAALPKAGLEYHWFEALGGRRSKEKNASSNNLGLRNESFRNYADYMLTPQFQEAVEQLLEIGHRRRTAFMCAEGLFWQCHRRLVCDFLLTKGIKVEHIMPSGELRSHTLTEGAKIDNGKLSYPAPDAAQTRFMFE